MRNGRVRRFILLIALVLALPAAAQAPRQIRVAVEFRQASQQSRDAVQGSGGVIITEGGQVQPQAGVVQSTQRGCSAPAASSRSCRTAGSRS